MFFLTVMEAQSQQAIALMAEESTELFLSDVQHQAWEYMNSVDTFSRGAIIKVTGLIPALWFTPSENWLI